MELLRRPFHKKPDADFLLLVTFTASPLVGNWTRRVQQRTVHFFKNGQKASEVVGADVEKLSATMEKSYKICQGPTNRVGSEANDGEGGWKPQDSSSQKMLMTSSYMSRLFPRFNSSFFLCSGNALQSEVLRLREEKFLVGTGIGPPRVCVQDELTGLPNNRATRFENKVGFLDPVAGESLIKKQILERFFIDLVAGESLMKERAAARFNDLVGSTDLVAGEPHLLLPQRFRQNRAWMELNTIWRRNTKVKGFIIEKTRGGYLVAIAGFFAILPFRFLPRKGVSNHRFTIESINNKKMSMVVI